MDDEVNTTVVLHCTPRLDEISELLEKHFPLENADPHDQAQFAAECLMVATAAGAAAGFKASDLLEICMKLISRLYP